MKSSWRTRAPKRLLSPLRRGRRDSLVRSPFQVHVQPVFCGLHEHIYTVLRFCARASLCFLWSNASF